MPDTLEQICIRKREHIAEKKKNHSLAELEKKILTQEKPRGFFKALQHRVEGQHLALICELKKASPSRGIIRSDFNPHLLASAYYRGGAACLSVLTDEPFFRGQDNYLEIVKSTVPIPILRKDFILDPYQVYESRALGADCILLILAALPHALACSLETLATDLGMDVLIETHDQQELDRALIMRSPMIGINNRNLKTLDVNIDVTCKLAHAIPKTRFLISESGIRTVSDLILLSQKASVKAFLIGETLMLKQNVEEATRDLIESFGAIAREEGKLTYGL